MNYPNGTIVKSEPVELKRAEANAVARLYNPAVLDEVTVERITYMSDGLKVNGYSARPKAQGHYPVLIWNRGGTDEKGALNDLTAYLILASTAQWGYIVLASHYRGNLGSEGTDEWGGADVNDAHNLVATARLIPGSDPSRMAIEGASRGGMTTYRVLTLDTAFKCAIVHAGVSDVVSLCCAKDNFARFCDQLLGRFSDEDRRTEVVRRSALHFAEKLPKETPILMLHGDQDKVIPKEQSDAFDRKLTELGIPHEYHVIPGGGHVALKDKTYRQIDEYRKAWLERYLATP